MSFDGLSVGQLLDQQAAELKRLQTVMQAAYDALHDDNDADSAERILRVALQASANESR